MPGRQRRAGREADRVSEVSESVARRTVGVQDILRVLLAPRQVFARVEDVPAWRWPLLILLTVVTLIGYATVQTGLIDREVDRQVQAQMAEIDRTQRDVVERSALRELYDQQHKAGEFMKLLTRMRAIVVEPVQALATVLLVAAGLYGLTALTGRKAEWHTLLTICVLAGFADALRLLVVLGLRLYTHVLDVDTSLALLLRLLPPATGRIPPTLALEAGLLTALDPFRMWYWAIVVIGLAASAQLPGWRAWVACGLCWLMAGGGRGGMDALVLLSMQNSGAPPG